MLDDNIEMAKKLRDLGNAVHVDVLQELPHGFLNFSLISSDARYCSVGLSSVLRCLKSPRLQEGV